jgi:hypothetical protein
MGYEINLKTLEVDVISTLKHWLLINKKVQLFVNAEETKIREKD